MLGLLLLLYPRVNIKLSGYEQKQVRYNKNFYHQACGIIWQRSLKHTIAYVVILPILFYHSHSSPNIIISWFIFTVKYYVAVKNYYLSPGLEIFPSHTVKWKNNNPRKNSVWWIFSMMHFKHQNNRNKTINIWVYANEFFKSEYVPTTGDLQKT